jgi:hypothetical protein
MYLKRRKITEVQVLNSKTSAAICSKSTKGIIKEVVGLGGIS